MATALVTGGTAGIGAAFARALAARGDDLVLVARDSDRLAAVAAEITERYAVAVETLPADLAVRAEVDRVAARIADDARPIDTLINNAGFGIRGTLTDADLSAHEHAIDVMIRAVLILGGSAGRAMKARGSGVIVNVSSTAGFFSLGGYSAIKAWVTSYSEGLSMELSGTGVSVTALCPGYVRTEFHSRAEFETTSIPGPLWLDADALVAEALRDAADHKVISIPSKRYKVLMFLARHVPRSLVRSASFRMTASRR